MSKHRQLYARNISLNGNICDDWGLTYVKLAPASYTMSFSDVQGFKTPTMVSVSQGGGTPTTQALTTPIPVTNGVTTDVVATFAPQGNLWVQTNPGLPATISVNGQPMDDWGFWTVSQTRVHTPCLFETISGFLTPPSLAVTVTGGATTHVVGDYNLGTTTIVP